MNLLFNLKYRTTFGECLVLNVIGSGARYVMATSNGVHWTCMVNNLKEKSFEYYYSVERAGKELRHEWLVAPHHIEAMGNSDKGSNWFTMAKYNSKQPIAIITK